MKKVRNLFLCVLLLNLLVFVFLFNVKVDDRIIVLDGIKYFVSVNGVQKDRFPLKGFYDVKTDCVNADSNWNYEDWVAEIYNINGDVSCKISFISTERKTLASYIKKNISGEKTSIVSESLNGDGSTLDKITDNGVDDYRYRGIDPQNYIWFNDELWRIIGVFDDNSHGIDNAHLVKIIRNNPIGNYLWDNSGSYGKNNYPDSDIFKLLNSAYYNAINGTGEDYCYQEWSYVTVENVESKPLKGKCNFTKKGLQNKYRDMVESNAKWFLGGTRYLEHKSSSMYSIERGTDVYGENDTWVKAKIGLMYASDYGYAAPSSCSVYLENYKEKGCFDKNWLKSNDNEWIITSASELYTVLYLHSLGNIMESSANYGFNVRPVLYLKSNVYYLSGTGAQNDPYIVDIYN